MINIGVIGYGYWGPNIVRNFSSLDGAKVEAICDRTRTRSTAPARRIRSSVRHRTAARFSTRRTSTPWRSSRRYRPITSWPSGRF